MVYVDDFAAVAEGREVAKPKWSKADVLEGALNVVAELRRQLAEERLARSLGLPPVGVLPEAAADILNGQDGQRG